MTESAKLLEILAQWNYWDRPVAESGIPRELTGMLIDYVKSPEQGRAGKPALFPGLSIDLGHVWE